MQVNDLPLPHYLCNATMNGNMWLHWKVAPAGMTYTLRRILSQSTTLFLFPFPRPFSSSLYSRKAFAFKICHYCCNVQFQRYSKTTRKFLTNVTHFTHRKKTLVLDPSNNIYSGMHSKQIDAAVCNIYTVYLILSIAYQSINTQIF
jgi:hypothetical protein